MWLTRINMMISTSRLNDFLIIEQEKYPEELINDVIENSSKVILKIKNYHDRPRPDKLAKKFGISLLYHKMEKRTDTSFSFRAFSSG